MSTPSMPSAPSQAPLKATEPPAIDVRSLFAGGREVVLLHNGERYHLRITANDKLILTK
ncbi:hemin uptake protein HemP [Chelatococcus caeni]|uniref:Hemin uptake protein HemP n=1 Tax=Chelatococcus caeni TaxID=1348468 RepID=A0A840C4G1_9HYPH|nr:hemin uptake protein HemP [Chelatococcus caeni]MBB4018508.1 hemin uptake protein HemP [Chelatococcus caeni]